MNQEDNSITENANRLMGLLRKQTHSWIFADLEPIEKLEHDSL